MMILYSDSKGELSVHISSKPRDDGIYLRGFCEAAKGLRTWRKDRIVQEFTDEVELYAYLRANPVDSCSDSSQCKPRARKPEGAVFEICFTGFPAKERAELEAKAAAFGMWVKSSVTVNLDLLCTGEKAGSVKMQKAEAQGTCLLTVDEFLDLVNDGVMPEGWVK
jgi:NAD-dependent DNA ligase